jgi:predicted outer membrane repeat protein
VGAGELQGNSAGGNGGAVSATASPSATLGIASSNLLSNTASLGGGAHADSVNVVLASTVVAFNAAPSGGGGLACHDCAALQIHAATFRNNTAHTGDGGAIRWAFVLLTKPAGGARWMRINCALQSYCCGKWAHR